MQIRELLVAPQQQHQSEDDGITLTQFTDYDDCDPKLRELSEEILKAESAIQVRMILSLYFPQYNWGGIQV